MEAQAAAPSADQQRPIPPTTTAAPGPVPSLPAGALPQNGHAPQPVASPRTTAQTPFQVPPAGIRQPSLPAGYRPPAAMPMQQQQGAFPSGAGPAPSHQPPPAGGLVAQGSTAVPPSMPALAAPPGEVKQDQDQQQQQANANGNGHAAQPPQAPSSAGNISPEDIQTVQNLVERCLQLYMARDEVVNVLKSEATIDPGFTQLVWSKLEEQNPEFFKCYYTRLKLKAQIVMFNHLLEQQVAVVQKMQHGWNASGAVPTSSTNSGIPLFQGANGSGSRTPVHGGTDTGKDRLVPGSNGDLMGTGLDSHGHALFSPLPHIGSEHDLANLGPLPTPGELGFLPNTSPLNLVPGSAPGTLPRNFSLSDLAPLDHDHEQSNRNGDETPPSFVLSEPML